jgi:dTDP-4-dehydrorhamnose 3,5-epimerase
MEIKELEIKGVFEILLNPRFDERGFFMRSWDQDIFRQYGLDKVWVQENHSRSERKYIIRGLHFQTGPFSETKLVRCIRGKIYDVAVDLRKESPTLGKWEGIVLSEENKKMFYIPSGFAHGFCTLSDISEVVYKVDNFYSPESERGILWNDPDLDISWPTNSPYLSEKDSKNMNFRDILEVL